MEKNRTRLQTGVEAENLQKGLILIGEQFAAFFFSLRRVLFRINPLYEKLGLSAG